MIRELTCWREWFPIFFSGVFHFSSHRKSGTGSVAVTATCATSPLSQITSETKSKNELTSGEKETNRRSKEPTVTATRKAETTEEATVYVNDWDVFVTMMLLEDSLHQQSVLS